MGKKELLSSMDDVLMFTCKKVKDSDLMNKERVETIKALAELVTARAFAGLAFFFSRKSRKHCFKELSYIFCCLFWISRMRNH